MRETFLVKQFGQDRLELIQTCNAIIAQYQAQGFRLTLRQLYYQLVTRNIIRNEERAYKRLGEVVSDGRLAGHIDWAAIEDRLRVPDVPSEWRDLNDLVEGALYSYRLPRWDDQPEYVELWVEKDALAGVLVPLAREYHVTLCVNRGYSSQSAMYAASKRFKDASGDPVLLYLGDHDPSGEDMVRDVRDRLTMFGVDVLVEKLALTMEQVRQYNPPPNPAKMTDSRAREYVAIHGAESWEVDALPPDVLQRLVRDAIEFHWDEDLMDAVKEREEKDKVLLREAVKPALEKKEDKRDGGA